MDAETLIPRPRLRTALGYFIHVPSHGQNREVKQGAGGERMVEARRRGSASQRQTETQAAQRAQFPATVSCNNCQAELTEIHSGMNGLIKATNSDHGTTRSISSRNTRRRVRLLDCPKPKLVCFMASIVSAVQPAR